MRGIKKIIVLCAVATMFVTTTLCASAAGLRDVFNAKYYADTYADLKAAFGYDENALYQHFITYGLKENRQMSPILDVQKYREAYADLDAAFGDNWDKYVEHYLTFGIKEKRTEGILFDPLAYAAAYPDIQAAFGDDVDAIIQHYLTFGIAEGRTAGVTVQTSSEAPAASSGGQSSQPASPPTGGTTPGSGNSTPSQPTPEQPTPDDPTPTPSLPTVYAYKGISFDDSNKVLLNASTAVSVTSGEGTKESPYVANVEDIGRDGVLGEATWFVVSLPKPEGDNLRHWLKIGSTWTDVSDNQKIANAALPENTMTFGVGSNIQSESLEDRTGDVELCMSTDTGTLTGGTYYKLHVTFVAKVGAAAEAVWAPLADHSQGDEAALTNKLNIINAAMSDGKVNTEAKVADDGTAYTLVTFNMGANVIPKHTNAQSAEAYFFGIGIPAVDSATYYWGFTEQNAGSVEGALAAIASDSTAKENTAVMDGGKHSFYWGLNTSNSSTTRWGYLVVKKSESVEATYILDFSGIKFEQTVDEN